MNKLDVIRCNNAVNRVCKKYQNYLNDEDFDHYLSLSSKLITKFGYEITPEMKEYLEQKLKTTIKWYINNRFTYTITNTVGYVRLNYKRVITNIVSVVDLYHCYRWSILHFLREEIPKELFIHKFPQLTELFNMFDENDLNTIFNLIAYIGLFNTHRKISDRWANALSSSDLYLD
jgi:hypothetical protein